MSLKDKIQAAAFAVLAVFMVGGGITWAVFYEIANSKADAEWKASLKFQQREVVELKVGGEGQIIEVHWDRFHEPYLIRVRIDEGLEDRWMHEYEVKQ